MNTLWIQDNDGGNAILYATCPILSMISKGLMNLGLSFPFFTKSHNALGRRNLEKYMITNLNSSSVIVIAFLSTPSNLKSHELLLSSL